VVEVELPDVRELEERRDKAFTRRVALTTAIYAVVLAVAALGGNNAMKEMLLAQQQSSDQWSFYQAKVIREHLYRAQKLVVDTTLTDGSGLPAPQRARLEALSQRLGEEEKRYATEKKDIELDAKKLEHERDVNRARDPYFDYAEVLLQIAIVTASVSILASSRPVFAFSFVLAIVGTALAVNGFALVVRLPFLHGH
jgi:hypothetical protein